MMTEEPGQCVHINSFFCVGEDLWHQKERSVLAQNLHSKLPTKKKIASIHKHAIKICRGTLFLDI